MTGITPGEAAFARHYILGHNAAKAAVAAGCTSKGAKVSGHRLLRRARV
jgi:phage terminase small subunit